MGTLGRGRGRLAAGLAAGRGLLRRARRQLRLMLGLLGLVARLRAGRDRRARLGNLRQPRFAQRQLVRDRHPVGNIRLIRRFGFRHQLGHFLLELRLDLAGMLVGQRPMPARIGADLRAIDRHRAQLEHASLARQHQNLHEQPLNLLEEASPKGRDRVVIGMLVRHDEPERHRIQRRPLQLPARKHPCRIAVHHQPQQQRRVVRRRSRTAVAPAHSPQVKAIDHLDHEPRKVTIGKPLVHRGRKQETRVAVDRPKVAHDAASHPSVADLSIITQPHSRGRPRPKRPPRKYQLFWRA